MIQVIKDIEELQNKLIRHIQELRLPQYANIYDKKTMDSYIEGFIPELFKSLDKFINSTKQDNNRFLYYDIDKYRLTLLSDNQKILKYRFDTEQLYFN